MNKKAGERGDNNRNQKTSKDTKRKLRLSKDTKGEQIG